MQTAKFIPQEHDTITNIKGGNLLFGCQQILIHTDKDTQAIIEYLCSESNKVFNCAVYYARQVYFKAHRYVSKAELDEKIKTNRHFQAMYSQAAQQTCHSVFEGFKSFKALNQLFRQGKLAKKPKPPKYRKNGLNVVSYALGIDPGMDNWVTCVSTTGTSFIVDGKHVKSLNRWYNKKVSTIKEGKPQRFWSKKLAHLTEKRNRQMRDAVNKAARLIVNHCLENNIGTVVFGWNQGQKQESNLGSKNNQKWVQVPTARLKDRISQLCEQYGIRFVETEESYTSKASFVDGDYLPKYGENPENWKPDARRLANASLSGRRVKRGLYRTATRSSQLGVSPRPNSLLNWYINADANGAGNILRKVATILGLNLSGVGRVSLTAPQRIFLWSAKKTRRDVVSTRPEVSASNPPNSIGGGANQRKRNPVSFIASGGNPGWYFLFAPF